MDYEETIEWLFRQLPMFSRMGAAAYKPGLDTSLALDAAFGHPHRKYKTIHVAGTNGKGSTSHSLAAVLQAQGYKTGLYTSPHLVDFRERIRVDGEMIPRRAVTEFVRRFREMDYKGKPSFFELTMMMAFDYFARTGVDYAVIEVGMGGRLDSTNIITPIGCVITNISRDHMQFLGDTLPKIAGEKAGIIKAGIPVVIGESGAPGVRRVFVEKASEVGAPILLAQEDTTLPPVRDLDAVEMPCFPRFSFPLKGDYQKANVRTILAALRMLRKAGVEISDEAVKEGLEHVATLTGLAGRWMKLLDSPLTIADTGHNEDGLTYNMRQLSRLMADRPGATLRIVLGFVADKDIEHILKLFPGDATYYITQAPIPRALAAPLLAEKCAAAGLKGEIYPTVKEAYRAARAEAEPEDIVYVGGSTFIVADLLTKNIFNK